MPEQSRTPTIQTLSCIPEAQTKCSPIEWLEKGGSGIWTVFGVRLMFFSKAWSPTTAPLFAEKSFFCEVFGQAIRLWRWSNFLHSHLAAGKQALHVNLDETGSRMHQVAVKGMLVNTAILEKRKSSFVNTGCFSGNAAGQFHVCYNTFVMTARPRNFCHIF
jgi:hypothetical protein